MPLPAFYLSPDLPVSIGLLTLLLEFWITSSVTVGYITALSLFSAYNTSYKAVDMFAMYALKYAEMLKIPFVVKGVIAATSAMSAAARLATGSAVTAVANVGWVLEGGIAKVMALPEDLICSLMFKRQCPQTAAFVGGLVSSEEAEGADKRLLLEAGEKEGDEMV